MTHKNSFKNRISWKTSIQIKIFWTVKSNHSNQINWSRDIHLRWELIQIPSCKSLMVLPWVKARYSSSWFKVNNNYQASQNQANLQKRTYKSTIMLYFKKFKIWTFSLQRKDNWQSCKKKKAWSNKKKNI